MTRSLSPFLRFRVYHHDDCDDDGDDDHDGDDGDDDHDGKYTLSVTVPKV